MSTPKAPAYKFSGYQKFVIAVLTFLQFTIILDFMVLAPLGNQLLDELHINGQQFTYVVGGYAISAGLSGLLAAGFADRFDRKKLLLFFYSGFVFGTFLCGIASSYEFLLFARIVTGIFGGVIGSITFAIVTDMFPIQARGRVMGFLQMGFASSQALGIPLGLYLARKVDWHAPFLLIVGVSVVVGIAIALFLKPVDAHLKIQTAGSPFQHLITTVSNSTYLVAFLATTLLATGGFMLMPLGTRFSVHNLGVSPDDLEMLYVYTGIGSLITGPLIGKLTDKTSKYGVFIAGTILGAILILYYTQLGTTPFIWVVALNIILFVGIMSRMIPASTLMSAIPEPRDRGAFMGINSSLQQIAGGISALIAGMIVIAEEGKPVENYHILGYVVVGTMTVTVGMMYFINRIVARKVAAHSAATEAAV